VEFCVDTVPSASPFGKVGSPAKSIQSESSVPEVTLSNSSSCLLLPAVVEGNEQESLSIVQIKTMASLVCHRKLQQKFNAEIQHEDSVSLSHMLEAFKQIGFSKSTLQVYSVDTSPLLSPNSAVTSAHPTSALEAISFFTSNC
jgi:hypothetical protein